MYYYFGDSFAKLSHQAKRGLSRISGSAFQTQKFKDSNQESPRLSQGFKKLGELNPHRLEFPILVGSTEASKFAGRFTQNLDLGNNVVEDAKKMAEEYRILQWEVLVQNLVEEDRNRQFCFHRTTDHYNIPGRPEKDFLIRFINRARMAECRSIRSSEGILMEESDDTKCLNSKICQSYDSFQCLLSKVPDFVSEDYVHSFVNMRNIEDPRSNVMLIRDSELSFFSLLWLLRYARHTAAEDWKNTKQDEKNCESILNMELTVRFRPGFRFEGGDLRRISSDWTPSKEDWSPCNIIEFAEEHGLIIRLRNSKCLLTRRWQSLIAWLKGLNTNLEKKYENDKDVLEAAKEVKLLSHDQQLIDRLRLKRLNYNKEVELSFIKDLWELLVSDDLKDLLKELDDLPETTMSHKEFAKDGFGPLLEFLDPILKVESSVGLEDVLLHCCRGFIPLEHLCRVYQPYELHLLVQALNWERWFPVNDKPAPISLGFAAIAGSVPYETLSDSESSGDPMIAFDQWLVPYQLLLSLLSSDSESNSDSESSGNPTITFDQWLGPYRPLFSTLSAEFALPKVKESSQRIGEQDQQRYFAHQTGSLLHTIWQDPNREKLDFHSGFALWLLNIQIDEVWGGFPFDPRQPIPDIFPDSDIFPKWHSLDEKQTVEKLIDLGLWGGIMRANKPRKKGGVLLKDHLLSEHAVSLRALSPKAAISQVHDEIQLEESILFKSPESTEFPQWVKTKAFAVCFYHGLRQAAYHALETFVLIDNKQKQEGKPCLRIKSNDQSVSILNRGEVTKEHLENEFSADDLVFFKKVKGKIDQFCDQNGIAEKFEIEGPKPVKNTGGIWQWIIKEVN